MSPKPLAIILATCTALYAAEKVEILRDEYGVPHIFASTAAAAAFASGYAQAEDRLEELLRNYRKAEGTMSEAFGPEFVFHDYRQRLWRHRQVAQEHYHDLDPKLRALCEAYQAGIKQFMREHPEQVPAWAPKLEPWQIIALGRYIIWGWPEGEAAGDLIRAGIQPDPVAYRGSNEMLLAPSRTAAHVPIAIVDPHLSWYGEFRFYEMRIYGGELSFSGACILGLPFPSLGHNRYLSVAMTIRTPTKRRSGTASTASRTHGVRSKSAPNTSPSRSATKSSRRMSVSNPPSTAPSSPTKTARPIPSRFLTPMNIY